MSAETVEAEHADAERMAEAIMPDNATGDIREMLIKAVVAGIMMERGRQRMDVVEARFLDTVKKMKALEEGK